MGNVRDPAVAGFFYPAERETLASNIAGYLSAAPVPATVSPKALIAPHAGYVYSGQVAANAYAAWRPEAESIKRIVLVGPAHRVAFQGIAAPTVKAFKTPLGNVPIDTDAVAAICDMPQVLLDDVQHPVLRGHVGRALGGTHGRNSLPSARVRLRGKHGWLGDTWSGG